VRIPGRVKVSRLPSQQRERLVRGFQVCAALLMLHQLAGKAARDGYYLTWLGPSRLPEMVAAAAAFSVAVSYLGARLFRWRAPARVLPVALLASGALQLGEWALLPAAPGTAAVLVYLHMFGLGAVLLSGFWSMLSEEFDPREAKRNMGKIAAAGTAGGIVGGILAERVVAWFQAGSLMLLLAAVHFACAVALFRLGPDSGSARTAQDRSGRANPPARPLEDPAYLRTLAALVLLGAVAAALVDFAFKFSASAAFGKGPALVRFFALFYTGVSVCTFLLQSAAATKALERYGLAKTMAALPAAVAGGSCLSMAFPGTALLAAVRAAEASLRGSLFRSGYEVCFIPLPAAEKRRVKILIDVGAERGGDMAGSLIVKFLVRFVAAQPTSWILLASGVFGAAALVLVRAVDQAYVRALARSLMSRGAELDLDGALDLTTRTVLYRSTHSSMGGKPVPASSGASDPEAGGDPVLLQLLRLRSPDPDTVRAAVTAADATDTLIAAQLVRLLGSPQFGKEAFARLQPVAEQAVGLLSDCLADRRLDFEVRRRIPGLLAGVPDQRAADGLLPGLEDTRLEVRCQCARALLRLKRARPELRLDREFLLAAVNRELAAGTLFGESQRLAEVNPDALGVGLDDFLKLRSDAGLQNVFTLLALEYPEEPLMIAFRALEAGDRHLLGTALEYLESILPAKTRQLLWEVVGEQPAGRAPRPAPEVLEDLIKASATVVMKLKDLNPDKSPPGSV
jgi:ATP:ADP antiporter, AAA family